MLYVRMQLNCNKFSQDEEMISAAHGLEVQEAITNATQVFLLFCFSSPPPLFNFVKKSLDRFPLAF